MNMPMGRMGEGGCYDLEAKQEVHSRQTYLTDTEQVTGYSWITHPFSWVISQVVTCRDRFSLIRILPYGVARLNRFHGCVVFLCPLSIRCRPVISSASTNGNTANNRLHNSDLQRLFIPYTESNCYFPRVDWKRALFTSVFIRCMFLSQFLGSLIGSFSTLC
jgi:hypothetical protein